MLPPSRHHLSIYRDPPGLDPPPALSAPNHRRTPPPAPAGDHPSHPLRRRPLSVQKSSTANRHLLPSPPPPPPLPPSPSPSLCSDCSRAASREAVCFIGNDGRVSACSARMALRLCKNLNCAASNPEYAAAMSRAGPKKYLVSKRHQLPYGVTNNKKKNSDKSSPSTRCSTAPSPSLLFSPSPSLQESKSMEESCCESSDAPDTEGTGDNFSTPCGSAFDSAVVNSGIYPGEDENLSAADQGLTRFDSDVSFRLQSTEKTRNVVDDLGALGDDDCGFSASNTMESDLTSDYDDEDGEIHRRKCDLRGEELDSAEGDPFAGHGRNTSTEDNELGDGEGSISASADHGNGGVQVVRASNHGGGGCGGSSRRNVGSGSGAMGVAEEKVSLRKGQVQGRKQAEEWMLDHAMEGVVQKLPPMSGKVKLLVQAFEAVIISASSSTANGSSNAAGGDH